MNNIILGDGECEYYQHGQIEAQDIGNTGMMNPPIVVEQMTCRIQGIDQWDGYAKYLKRQNRNTVLVRTDGEPLLIEHAEIAVREEGELLTLRILAPSHP